MKKVTPTIESIIKKINSSIAAYLDGQINEHELSKRLQKYSNTKVGELLAKSGNYLVDIALQTTEDLAYSLVHEQPERKKHALEWLSKYYAEFKAGKKPYETSLSFTYKWKSTNFKLKVEHTTNG